MTTIIMSEHANFEITEYGSCVVDFDTEAGHYFLLVKKTGDRSFEYRRTGYDKKALFTEGREMLERFEKDQRYVFSINDIDRALDILKETIKAEGGDPDDRFKVDDIGTDVMRILREQLS